MSIALQMNADDISTTASHLINTYHANGVAAEAMNIHLDMEIQDRNEGTSILRDDSFLSKLYRRYTFIVGLPYLWHSIAGPLHSLHVLTKKQVVTETGSTESTGSMSIELDLRKTLNQGGNDDLQRINMYQLKLTAQQIFSELMQNTFPPELRVFMHNVESTMKYSENDEQQTSGEKLREVFASCAFLRYVCPALAAPHLYGLTDAPAAKMLRVCILVSKVLQNLANGRHFKEEYMTPMNDFIDGNIENMDKWVKSLPLDPLSTDIMDLDSQALSVPEDVHKNAVISLLVTALSDRESFLEVFREELSPEQFKKCSVEYLKPIGFFEMISVRATSYKKRYWGRVKRRQMTTGSSTTSKIEEEENQAPVTEESEDILFSSDISTEDEGDAPKRRKTKDAQESGAQTTKAGRNKTRETKKNTKEQNEYSFEVDL
jgi:hypothetical protein